MHGKKGQGGLVIMIGMQPAKKKPAKKKPVKKRRTRKK
jgi:hypothetical protein